MVLPNEGKTSSHSFVLSGPALEAQIQATRERSVVWRELKLISEYIASTNVTIYLRAGTWLAAYRQSGYSPFDRD